MFDKCSQGSYRNNNALHASGRHMSTTDRNLHVALQAEVGRQIQELERVLRVTLEAIPECRVFLAEQARASGSSRHAEVELLLEANLLAKQASGVDAQLLAQAATAIAGAQALRWDLAVTAAGIAKQEARNRESWQLVGEDLEQEAMLGLYAAARRFDPERGVSFSSYARWWVRAQLARAVQLSPTVAPTAAVLQLHRNARQLLARDEQAGVSRPIFALASELGVGPERLWDMMAAATLRAVETLGDEDQEFSVEALADTASPTPEEAATTQDMRRWLHEAIRRSFTERDREILARRYGFGVEVAPISMIAASLSLSPERVRQLEEQSVAVLRDQIAREMNV